MAALGGLDTGGVKDLRSEICQLGGFLEVEATYGSRSIDDTGVVVVHAIDIRPDLDLVDLKGGTDERGGIVATPALQVVDIAEGIATDVALRDEELRALGCSLDELREMGLDIVFVGLSLLIGTHVLQCREADRTHASVLKVTQHHRCAEELPTCQDLLLVEECEGIRVAELLEEEERLIDQGPSTVVAVLVGEEQLRLLLVLMLELREDGEGFMAVMRHELVPDLYEGVCRTGHSREDNNLRLIGSCDEVSYVGYALGRGNGGASELHYFQRLRVLGVRVEGMGLYTHSGLRACRGRYSERGSTRGPDGCA